MMLGMFDYDIERFKKLITLFKLEDNLHKNLDELSKGMKQKLSLLLCLVRNKELYLLDEPLDGLDDLSKQNLIEYIKKDNRYYLISTHNHQEFEKLSCEVVKI